MTTTVYSYRCANCRRAHDIPGMQGVKPADSVSCPYCGHEYCYRVRIAPAVNFVGSGWTGAGKEPRK